jgi:hypothetical protein
MFGVRAKKMHRFEAVCQNLGNLGVQRDVLADHPQEKNGCRTFEGGTL